MMGNPMAPLRGPGAGPRGTSANLRGAAMGRGDYGEYQGLLGRLYFYTASI